MKTRITFLMLMAGVLLTTQLASAQVVRDRAEKSTDRKEIKVSSDILERDVAEANEFTRNTEAFKAAYMARDKNKILTLQSRLLADMNREIQQSTARMGSDARETRRSNREVASSGRDVRQSRADRADRSDRRKDDVRDLRDDRRDRRDDVRDLQDDRRDYASTAVRLERQKEIRNAFASWTFSTGSPKKIEALAEYALLKEFGVTLEEDIRATRIELGEDIGELREDRRELREDKRERRELR